MEGCDTATFSPPIGGGSLEELCEKMLSTAPLQCRGLADHFAPVVLYFPLIIFWVCKSGQKVHTIYEEMLCVKNSEITAVERNSAVTTDGYICNVCLRLNVHE
jgi:hypothetical protein